MVTKTQEVLDNMNYFLDYKESGGGYTESYNTVFGNLTDIFANQVKNGLHTEEEIETFKGYLPSQSEMFEHKDMHPDFVGIPDYFDQAIKVAMANMEHTNSEKGITR